MRMAMPAPLQAAGPPPGAGAGAAQNCSHCHRHRYRRLPQVQPVTHLDLAAPGSVSDWMAIQP